MKHSLHAFGRLLVHQFEDGYPDQTYIVTEVQLQQRDYWSGQVTSVDPNTVRKPRGFVDRYYLWSTQKTNIIRQPPRGVAIDLNVRNDQFGRAVTEPPRALGMSNVMGGRDFVPPRQP
jgi:hypothetical protein